MERTHEDLLKEVEVLRRQSDDKDLEIIKLKWRLDEAFCELGYKEREIDDKTNPILRHGIVARLKKALVENLNNEKLDEIEVKYMVALKPPCQSLKPLPCSVFPKTGEQD